MFSVQTEMIVQDVATQIQVLLQLYLAGDFVYGG